MKFVLSPPSNLVFSPRRYGRGTWVKMKFLENAAMSPIGARLAWHSPKYLMIATKIDADLFSIVNHVNREPK